MKALDTLLALAAIVVIVAYLMPTAFEIYPLATPQTQFWLRSVAGVFVKLYGGMPMLLVLISSIKWIVLRRGIGLLHLCFLGVANAVRLYVAALAILAGIQVGTWVDLPPNVVLTPEPYRSAVTAIFLTFISHYLYLLAEWRAESRLHRTEAAVQQE